MATTTRKPAANKPAKTEPAKQPAKKADGVSLKDLAEKLGQKEKPLRARIRRINGGPLPGKGGRYSWPSFNDPGLKELISKLQGETKAEKE